MATVYLSSVSQEFASYGKALQEQFFGAEHELVSRDSFPVDPSPLVQQIEAHLTKCDLVICIMGERYGPEPPEPERMLYGGGRVSYAQWEFLLAYKLGKPTHIFYASDEALLDSVNDEAADLTRLQESFLAHEVVAKEL
ncbi:MAG: DUF4062 domain-containing protein, partial [Verrucomicrobiota bacterium]